MKISVFGATGGTGREIIEQALAVGTDITVLVRDPARLSDKVGGVYIVTGDVLDPRKVQEALGGADAVVVSLGNRSDSPENTVSEGTKNIIMAMQKGPDRILVMNFGCNLFCGKPEQAFGSERVQKIYLGTEEDE